MCFDLWKVYHFAGAGPLSEYQHFNCRRETKGGVRKTEVKQNFRRENPVHLKNTAIIMVCMGPALCNHSAKPELGELRTQEAALPGAWS